MTPASVTAFCPGHISGYFRRVDGKSPASTGSIGAGIVISEGVTSVVRPAGATSITVKRVRPGAGAEEISRESPPLASALERIGATVRVETTCTLPISAGFGLSAAALLSTLAAADRLLGLGLGADDIAEVAHETEVLFRTGLGDVAACQAGGRVVRNGPGISGEIIRKFDITDPLYTISFGQIPTPSVLGSPEQMAQVTAAFPDRQPAGGYDFFTLAREFSRKSRLETPRVTKVLSACDKNGIPAAMTMLGEGVFACGEAAQGILAEFGEVFGMEVARMGTRILEVEA
ncbi:MAG: pantoate kinase [Methanoregula sp.]|jgi:pantoate kinase